MCEEKKRSLKGNNAEAGHFPGNENVRGSERRRHKKDEDSSSHNLL